MSNEFGIRQEGEQKWSFLARPPYLQLSCRGHVEMHNIKKILKIWRNNLQTQPCAGL